MKRILVYPAAASAAMFLVMMMSFAQSTEHQRGNRASLSAYSTSPELSTNTEQTLDWASPIGVPRHDDRTSVAAIDRKAADALIEKQLLQPWRLASISQRHLFSRAGPTLPTVEAEIHIARQSRAYFLGLASLSSVGKEKVSSVPFVIDRETKQLLVMADGRWQDHQQWIEKLQSDQNAGADRIGYLESVRQ